MVAPALRLTIFNLTYPRRRIPAFLPMVIKLVGARGSTHQATRTASDNFNRVSFDSLSDSSIVNWQNIMIIDRCIIKTTAEMARYCDSEIYKIPRMHSRI